jgi:hypothetical protein
MHCIVPFAAPGSEAGRAQLASMQWPRLASLLPRLALAERDDGDAASFSPPHERVLARSLGWAPAEGDSSGSMDGRWPVAAHLARLDGIEPGAAAWGLMSPVHWLVGTDQVSLADPQMLQLDEPTSRALFDAVRPLLAEEGLRFEFGHAQRWYVSHESLAGLRTASLDRVVGRNVDAWLGGHAEAGALRRWRRLQSEVQMLLHTHPVNAEREARGLLPINSFWLSGCGRLPATATREGPELVIEPMLRAAALAEDWPAWAAGWRRLEDGLLLGLDLALRRGNELSLTLAGERCAVTFGAQRGGLIARLKSVLQRPSVPELLASL